MRQQLRRNAVALVADDDARAVAERVDVDVHGGPAIAVLERVAQQVAHDLLQSGRVPLHGRAARDVGDHLDAARGGRHRQRIGGGGDDAAEIHALELQRQPPAPQPREIDEIRDDPRLQRRVTADRLQGAGHERRSQTRVGHRGAPAEDRSERRPELVRHHGHEVVLGTVGILGLGAGGALALEQHRARALRAAARVVERAHEQRHEDEDRQPRDRLLGERERRPRGPHHGIERERREHRCEQPAARPAEPRARRHRRHEQR